MSYDCMDEDDRPPTREAIERTRRAMRQQDAEDAGAIGCFLFFIIGFIIIIALIMSH